MRSFAIEYMYINFAINSPFRKLFPTHNFKILLSRCHRNVYFDLKYSTADEE